MNSASTALLEAPISESLPQITVPKKRFFDRLLIPATALFVLVCAIPILTFPPGRDQGTYLEIGQSLLKGKHLYAQLWDNKPPGIFVVYAAITKIFGKSLWSPAAVDIVLLFAISYLLFRFVEPYLGRGGAAITVVIHAAWHSGMRYFWIAQPETFQVFCVLTAHLLLISRSKSWRTRCLAAGLVCGFGFWQKYNFVAFLSVPLLLPFLDSGAIGELPPRLALSISVREWLERVVWVASGFGLTVVAVMIWISQSGAWPMMRESQFEVLPRYAHMAMTEQPHYWLMAVVRTYFSLRPETVFAALAALIIAWCGRDLKRLLPIFFSAAVALVATVMQVRFHSYYFQVCYPFFAALWAYLAVRLFEAATAITRLLKRHGQRLAAALVWILFANIIFWPIPEQITKFVLQYEALQQWHSNREIFYANYPEQLSIELLRGQFEVVHYVERTTQPTDPIYLWGSNSLIYFLTDRQPPTRFVLNLGVIAKWGKESWKDEIMRGVEAANPRLIIVTKHDALPTITYEDRDSEQYLHSNFVQLDSYIDRNYTRAVDFEDFVIYRRN
jgi:hypothetical protein